MLLSVVRKLPPLQRFAYFINERESVHIKKGNGAISPWTDDEIIQKYRFTNVVRIEDKVSQWLMNNWYVPYRNHSNMLVACAIARFFNSPESLALLTKQVFVDSFGLKQMREIKRLLRARKEKGNTLFRAAYMVRGQPGEDKVESVIGVYVRSLITNKVVPDTSSMEETWNRLMNYHGYGSFMAGQVVADLRFAVDGAWNDRNDWAPIGPGSKKGMNILLNRPIKTAIKQTEFVKQLLELRRQMRSRIPIDLYLRMEAIDLQNCCCEISKYERALWGEGTPKQLYNGAG